MNWWNRTMVRQPIYPRLVGAKDLPFIAKTTQKPDTTMEVIVGQADMLTCHGFEFAKKLVETLEALPYEKGVFFPKIEGGLARAEVLMMLDYDDDRRPAATLIFISAKQQMQMNYYVKVTVTNATGTLALRLTMAPNAKLKKGLYRSTESVAKSYAEAMATLIQNFNVGSAYRKIGPLLFVGKK